MTTCSTSRQRSRSEPQGSTLGSRLLRDALYGPEKFCTRCNEWWPADREFFYPQADSAGGLFYWCKACYAEWKRGRAAIKRQGQDAARTSRPTERDTA